METRVTVGVLVGIIVMLSIVMLNAQWGEVVYKSNTVVVITKPSLETVLELEVMDERGEPVRFVAFLSGPTDKGFVEIGKVRGHGRGGIVFGRYVAEIAKYAKELGWKPNEVSFGILAFIVTSQTIDNETYVLTDIVTIPINPEKAKNKITIAKITFKPVIRHKIEKEQRDKTKFCSQLQTPPQTIDDYCDIGSVYCYCYRWELVGHEKIEYNTGIPLAITYLDSIDARNIRRVYHFHDIIISTVTTTYISFDMALNLGPITIVPGDGFKKELTSQSETLFRFSCTFRRTDVGSSVCYYFGSPFMFSSYSGASLLATGIRGDVYIPVYNYVEEKCVSIEGAGCHCYDKRVVTTSKGVWIAPRANNGKFINFVEIDPYDGSGRIEQIYESFKKIAIRKELPRYYIDLYEIVGSQLVSSSSSTRYFAIGITPDVLPTAVGIEVGTTSRTFFNNYVIIQYETDRPVYFNPRYFELQNYLIREAGGYYNVPLPIVWPFTT